jgi:hypothetical protein
MGRFAVSLAEYPHDLVRLACERCGRAGQYHRARLIEQYGGEIAMPDLRHAIARCPRVGEMGDPCGVRFVEP